MRWIESVPEGQRTWYVAALRPDASYWGYVHVRTATTNENQSFDGQLDAQKYEHIRSLVDSADVSGTDADGTETLDGLIGLGSHSDFTTIVRYNPEPSSFPNSEMFREIVDILQPVVNSAANLSGR